MLAILFKVFLEYKVCLIVNTSNTKKLQLREIFHIFVFKPFIVSLSQNRLTEFCLIVNNITELQLRRGNR